MIRLLKRMPVQVSVATCALSCLAFVLGSNLLYFWHRTNFYSIPFASGLFLTFLGMWLWLGAPVARKRTCTLGRSDSADAASLSLLHVALGALCIAATIGCRPTFALTALLAIALFFPAHPHGGTAPLAFRRCVSCARSSSPPCSSWFR